MPTIADASVAVTSYPNKFVSPYGNDGVVPLYSSMPLKSPAEGCLDCVVCGNSIVRNEIIANSSQRGTAVNGVVTIAPTPRHTTLVVKKIVGTALSNGDGSVIPSTGNPGIVNVYVDDYGYVENATGSFTWIVTSPSDSFYVNTSVATLEKDSVTGQFYWHQLTSTPCKSGGLANWVVTSEFKASCDQTTFVPSTWEFYPWSNSGDYNRTTTSPYGPYGYGPQFEFHGTFAVG